MKITSLTTSFCLAICLASCLLFSSAHAATIHVTNLGHRFGTPTKDTMIFANSGSINNGAGGAPGFFAGTNSGAGNARRGLLSFDVGTIPRGSTINSVELTLYIGQVAGSGGGSGPGGTQGPTIGLHKLLIDWGEAGTGRTTADSVNGTGQGMPAEVGDSTWLERFSDGNNSINSNTWGTPGGLAGTDFVTTASASLVQGNLRYDQSKWLSTAALVADVQSWVDGASENYGWMLINTNEIGNQTFRGFYSHDFNPPAIPTNPAIPSGSPLDEVADFWPVLTVTYSIPEPSTLIALSVSLGLLASRRR